MLAAGATRGLTVSTFHSLGMSILRGRQFNDSDASIVFTSAHCLERVKSAAALCPRVKAS